MIGQETCYRALIGPCPGSTACGGGRCGWAAAAGAAAPAPAAPPTRTRGWGGCTTWTQVLYCTVLYWLHHLDSGTVLLLVLGPCSLLLLVYILVMLCRSEVFTLSIGEWPLAITVTWGLERLHCTAQPGVSGAGRSEQTIILLRL